MPKNCGQIVWADVRLENLKKPGGFDGNILVGWNLCSSMQAGSVRNCSLSSKRSEKQLNIEMRIAALAKHSEVDVVVQHQMDYAGVFVGFG